MHACMRVPLDMHARVRTHRHIAGVRQNQAFLLYDEGTFTDALFDRIRHALPEEIDGKRLVGLSHGYFFFRYQCGDVFKRHTDGEWPGKRVGSAGIEPIEGTLSKLSMTMYLNGEADGVLGGCTRLYGADEGWVSVAPTQGSALFFRHGFGPGTVWHEGEEVFEGTPKYVARVNVLYEE